MPTGTADEATSKEPLFWVCTDDSKSSSSCLSPHTHVMKLQKELLDLPQALIGSIFNYLAAHQLALLADVSRSSLECCTKYLGQARDLKFGAHDYSLAKQGPLYYCTPWFARALQLINRYAFALRRLHITIAEWYFSPGEGALPEDAFHGPLMPDSRHSPRYRTLVAEIVAFNRAHMENIQLHARLHSDPLHLQLAECPQLEVFAPFTPRTSDNPSTSFREVVRRCTMLRHVDLMVNLFPRIHAY